MAEHAATVEGLLVSARGMLRADRDAARRYIEKAAALLDEVVAVENAGKPPAAAANAALVRGGLAPWQMKRVRAHVEERLGDSIAIEELAEVCRLSVSHFSRAFKASFGEPPHGYIVTRRVEAAKRAMLTSDEPLSQIAAACGFADQSHFCRHFRRAEGKSPNLWRRERAVGPELLAAE
ncbi:AraC family transcriptional regulator [Pelagibius sp. 7325]|uniref:AraC family transcriptional regulator n=1 Tax=Pelagibius sp. 7325 TaxID=3131994 RepID=UPI0030EC7280